MKSIAVLMLGLGFGVFGFAAHAQSAQAPSFGGCWPRAPQIRPGQILMACGDGGFVLTGLVWTRWDAAQALGTGVGHTNTCTPLCASGNFHRSRVSLRARVHEDYLALRGGQAHDIPSDRNREEPLLPRSRLPIGVASRSDLLRRQGVLRNTTSCLRRYVRDDKAWDSAVERGG